MQRQPRMALQPQLDLGCLVAGHVVDDEMEVEALGDASVDQVQETTKLSARCRSDMSAITGPEAMSRAA